LRAGIFNMQITIRRAITNDAELLVALGKKTFFEKWKDTTPAENMNHYLAETFTTEKLSEEIADASVIYLIAADNGNAVGYAKLMHTQPDIEVAEPGVNFTHQNPIEVSRIYVSPELIGKNIGARLMEKVFEIAKEENCDLIWLGVWEKNERAIAFYSKWGFEKYGEHLFMLGSDAQTDFLMSRKL